MMRISFHEAREVRQILAAGRTGKTQVYRGVLLSHAKAAAFASSLAFSESSDAASLLSRCGV
jgi:hypothetical protein